MESVQQLESTSSESPLARIGIPPALAWGYLGLFLFMVGDGVESGYLAPYLVTRGYAPSNVAWIFASYGLMAGIAGWLSGSLSDAWGPRRVITLGFTVWVGFEILFLLFGLSHGFTAILITYGLRGLGYPLFAFGFLVWITVVAPSRRLASGMGWFWFAFTGGLPTLGSLVAGWCVPRFGQVPTLWVGAAFVVAGGITLLLGVREPRGAKRLVAQTEAPLTALWHSISLIWRRPKTGIACLTRLINTAPEFGFLVFLPTFFTHTIGFSLVRWLHLLSAIFLSNIIWNLLFGLIGDRIGWIRTISIFGGVGSALSTLAIYYVPQWHHNYAMTLVAGACYGATLAAYVPLSALMTSLAPEEKGASLSLLSLGAGASVSVGPALVALFLKPFGVGGVMWIFAAMYLLSAVLALKLKLDSTSGAETV
jgi:polyol permease family